MNINFPISNCPHCHHDEFHNNIGINGVSKITYNNKGEPIARKIINVNYKGVRESWFCNQCERQVFTTKECS